MGFRHSASAKFLVLIGPQWVNRLSDSYKIWRGRRSPEIYKYGLAANSSKIVIFCIKFPLGEILLTT